MRFQIIKENRSAFPVKKMCQVFRVSPSGYYRWRTAPTAPGKLARQELQCAIKELYVRHKGMAGSPLITADLHDRPEYAGVSRPRVARLMMEMGLKCRTVKKFVATTNAKHSEPVAANLLNRHFSTAAPNQVWVSDITYLAIGGRWHYLSVFIDLFSRMVVGWDLSASLERHSTIKALQKALWRRNPSKGLVIHSDRGIQFASADFRAILNQQQCIQSMSRKGNCWDNAVAESFFHTLKTQLIHHCIFQSVNEAEKALFYYIEVYYNRQRKHSTNGYRSPAHFEQQWWNDYEGLNCMSIIL